MRNAYDHIARQWHADKRAPAYVERVLSYVDRALAGLTAGAQVLDLGCGTGEPIARHIAGHGFRLTCVDESREMLEFARQTVPNAEFIHASMVDLELTATFDAAIAWDSVFHVERRHHAAIYRTLSQALKIGGRLLLSVGGSAPDENDETVESFTSEMFGETFYYSGFAPDVARQLIEDAGFKIELWEVDDPSSRGHIAAIARRAD